MPPQKSHGSSNAEDLYRVNPDWYEDSLLLATLRCPELWPVFRKTLCLNAEFKGEVNDFQNTYRFNLYRAIKKYRDLQASANISADSTSMSHSTIQQMLLLLSVENASLMLPTDIEPTMKVYDTIVQDTQTETELTTLIKCTYNEWITERKMASIQEEASYIDAKGSELLRMMQSASDELRARLGSEDEDTLKDVASILDQDEVVTERMPLPGSMDAFNRALGGGLGRKEHIMVVGPTGAGKTVFACQVAAAMASIGYKVCYVTTEQPANEILPRMVSYMSKSKGQNARIPFNVIKDGIERDKLSPEQAAHVEATKNILNGNLGIEEWLGSGLTASDLAAVVRKFKNRYGGVDVLILDWIGGALVNGVDPQYKRDYYLEAARKMKDLAYDYNIATISMVQATADVAKVKKISDRHIAECKTMHREAVAGFGISALAVVGEDTEATYKDEQYLHAFKSRKAPGLLINLTREFDYQAFKFGSCMKS